MKFLPGTLGTAVVVGPVETCCGAAKTSVVFFVFYLPLFMAKIQFVFLEVLAFLRKSLADVHE
jgi:hypothetical protein